MKSEQPEIDKLFTEKLYHLESKPKTDSWQAISGKLDKKDKEENAFKLNNKTVRLRFYLAAAAVLFIIVIFSLLQGYKREESSNHTYQPTKVSTPSGNISTISPKVLDYNQKKPEKEESSEKVINGERPNKDVLITLKTLQEKDFFYLPDSSKIYANRNSEISYHEDFEKNRILNITGEVYFEVKHRNNQPFVIYANRSRTEVIGTSFMIRSYKDEMTDDIFVSSGKVAFASHKNPRERIFLEAGDQGTLNQIDPPKVTKITDVNYDAWKAEKIIFKGSKMNEVISTLEKYYNISIQVKDPEIMNCKYTGIFNKSNINNTLDLLSVSFNLSYDKQDGKYVLSGKGCK